MYLFICSLIQLCRCLFIVVIMYVLFALRVPLVCQRQMILHLAARVDEAVTVYACARPATMCECGAADDACGFCLSRRTRKTSAPLNAAERQSITLPFSFHGTASKSSSKGLSQRGCGHTRTHKQL